MGYGVAIAVFAGLLIGAQVAVLGRQARDTSPLTVSLLVHVGGLLAAMLWATLRQTWAQVPVAATGGWWWLAVGTAGWLIVASLAGAAARVGPAVALTVVVATQLTVGLALDWRVANTAVSGRNLLGVVLLVAGAYLVSSR